VDIRDKAGILKASVFPEPVSAMPTTSLYRPLESELSRMGCACVYVVCVRRVYDMSKSVKKRKTRTRHKNLPNTVPE